MPYTSYIHLVCFACYILLHYISVVCTYDVIIHRARGVYERALAELSDSEKTEKLFSAFAHFEERCKEFDRAR